MNLIKMFVEQICADKEQNTSWTERLTAFLAQAEPLLGRLALVASTRASETADVPSSFLENLLALRKQVDQLSDEVRCRPSQHKYCVGLIHFNVL